MYPAACNGVHPVLSLFLRSPGLACFSSQVIVSRSASVAAACSKVCLSPSSCEILDLLDLTCFLTAARPLRMIEAWSTPLDMEPDGAGEERVEAIAFLA